MDHDTPRCMTFGQGGLSDQIDVDQSLHEIALERSKIAWHKEFTEFDDKDAGHLESSHKGDVATAIEEQDNRIAEITESVSALVKSELFTN